MRFAALLLVLAALFFAPDAAAEETRWYGWQTMAVDAAAGGVLAGTAVANGDGPLFLNSTETSGKYFLAAGLTTYALGAPLVHLAHGQPLKALVSFALRGGLPLVAGGTGFAIGEGLCGGGMLCGVVGGVLPAIGGMLAASVIDASVLAREPVRAAPGFSVGLAPTRGGATAGLSGIF